jgi:hypothetical protein
MVYVTSHLESDRSILGEHATEQVGLVPLLDAFMDAQHNHVCTIVPYYENKDAFEVRGNPQPTWWLYLERHSVSHRC